MAKIKTSEKQEASSQTKHFVKVDESKCKIHDPFEYLLDKKNILKAIEECVQENDLEGVIEMIRIYRRAVRESKRFDLSAGTRKTISRNNYESQSTTRPTMKARSSKGRSSKKIV